MSISIIEVKNLNPADLESVDECMAWLNKLDGLVGDMEGQRLVYLRNGAKPNQNGEWLRRITHAIRAVKSKRDSVSQRKGVLRREDFARAGVVPERVFKDVAKEMLPKETYWQLCEEMRKRCDEQMQGQ